jgi:hypothetical protein
VGICLEIHRYIWEIFPELFKLGVIHPPV